MGIGRALDQGDGLPEDAYIAFDDAVDIVGRSEAGPPARAKAQIGIYGRL